MQKSRKAKARILSILLVTAMVISMSAFMNVPVNASDLTANDPNFTYLFPTVSASIDYINETLTFTVCNEDFDKDGFYVLYSPKAVPNEYLSKSYKYDSEKWYPVFISATTKTGTIDISKYIPKFKVINWDKWTEKNDYYIAYRLVNDDITIETNESSNGTTYDIKMYYSRDTINIPMRQPGKSYKIDGETITDSDLKSLVTYFNGDTAATGLLKNASTDLNASVRIGLNKEWVTIPANSDLSIPNAAFPTGDTAEIKWAADQYNFASTSIKVKIPATPKAPKLTSAVIVDTTINTGNPYMLSSITVYKGFTDKMQYSLDGITWTNIPADKVMVLNDAGTTKVHDGKGMGAAEIWKILTGIDFENISTGNAIEPCPSIYFRTSGTTSKLTKGATTPTYNYSKPNSDVISIDVIDSEIISADSLTDPPLIISGTAGKAITSVDIRIILDGDQLKSDISMGTDLSSWITNLPAGLTAKAADNDMKTGPTGFWNITISGTPTKAVTGPMTIKIPGTKLLGGTDVTVETNASFNITAP